MAEFWFTTDYAELTDYWFPESLLLTFVSVTLARRRQGQGERRLRRRP